MNLLNNWLTPIVTAAKTIASTKTLIAVFIFLLVYHIRLVILRN